MSNRGVTRARALASRVDAGRARTVYSSVEPKAVETATALGSVWELPVHAVDGLHEHDRSTEGLLTPAEFDRRIRACFERPSDVAFGTESAEAARRRFTSAVLRLLLSEHGDVVVVTHGTVLTLFVSGATGMEPFGFWKRLGMPCAVVLAVPELTVSGVIQLDEP